MKYTSQDLPQSQTHEASRQANEGAKNVIVQSPIITPQSDNLGLLTTKTIAEGLKISEDDVINLITTDQLKGKKIGDKYFVLKEEFEVFMKK